MKNIMRIVLLVGVVLFLQNCSNDYKKAQSFADAGNYEAFYSEIGQDVKNGDNQAKNLLIDYFLRAVQDSDVEEVEYYLKQDSNLINEFSEDKYRAIDVALVDNIIRLKMLKFLLKYEPKLDYVIEYYPDKITPLQLLAVKKESFESLEAIRLLINAGANVNFYTEKGTASISPLLYSYLNDNLKVFNILLKHGAEIKNIIPVNKKNKNDILSYIAGSIMNPKIKTSKSNILISPLYDTSGNRFTPFSSKLLSA